MHTKNMKKKQYIKPQMEVLELTTVSMLATSGPTISDEKVEGGIWEANDRRGSWGNLWRD